MWLIVCGSEASEYGALSTNDHFGSSEKLSNLIQQSSRASRHENLKLSQRTWRRTRVASQGICAG